MSRMSRRKVWQDLWQHRTRSLLLIVAIALGIMAVGTAFRAHAILSREIDRSLTPGRKS